MKYRRLWFIASLVVSAVAWASALQAASPGSEACSLAGADVKAIRAMESSHEAQGLAADWKGMSATWAPDIVLTPPNHSEIVGRETALAWASSFPAFAEYKFTIEEVAGCGDLAYVKTRYFVAREPPEGG